MLKNNVYSMPNIGAPSAARTRDPSLVSRSPLSRACCATTVPAEVIERMAKSFASRDPATAARKPGKLRHPAEEPREAQRAGVRIILGSDTGLEDHFFGYAEQKELDLMVQAGMTPSQVIVAATSRAAEFIGLFRRGVLAPGKRADFLVLDANPLDDIRNTRRIRENVSRRRGGRTARR